MLFTIYQLSRCGFYKLGEAMPQFGAIQEWWHSFVKWANEANSVMATQTYRDKASKIVSTYCTTAFMDESNTGYGLVLWNEIPHLDNAILTIPNDGNVGTVDADSTNIGENRIPGYPAHFWILPQKNIIVSLLPQDLPTHNTGIVELRKYFYEYLKTRSMYCKMESDTTNEHKINAWAHPDGCGEITERFPVFETKPAALPGQIQYIKDNHASIHRLIVHRKLEMKKADHRGKILKAFEAMGFPQGNDSKKHVAIFNTEIEWHPSEEDLEEAIETYIANPSDKTGVKISGEQDVFWFHSMRASDEIALPDNLDILYLWKKADLISVWNYSKSIIQSVIEQIK